ncbi:MAG: hypothetical protein DDT18_00598 [Actinobacteria bacterium]|nr:hypothetical protein [Actinomycetota bacterium]
MNNVVNEQHDTTLWKTLEPNVVPGTSSFLFYGASGTGKTRLVGQFPDVLILACDPGRDGGAISARQFEPKVIVIRDYTQLTDLLANLQPMAGKEFKTLAIDSLSYLQRIVMNNILKKSARETPRFDEWNLSAERVRNLINVFADFNCYTIFTATEQMTKDEISGRLIGGPNLPGKLAVELPQACDVVCRLSVSTSVTAKGPAIAYRFQSVPDDIWPGKDRFGVLPAMGETSIEAFKPLLTY